MSGTTNRVRPRTVMTIAKVELKQFTNARDQWLPMVFLGTLFFVIIPGILLLSIGQLGRVEMVRSISETLDVLPKSAFNSLDNPTPQAKVMYALAVYLFAPISIVVPLTICSAIGAAAIVGERERGTGEFLAHSPAGVRELFLGKLIASLIPGYLVTVIGFAAYSLVVNTLAGGIVGRWFFPTPEWWGYLTLTIPAFLILSLSIVLRLSAYVSSTAAAQQAAGLVSLPLIGLTYGQSSTSIVGGSASGVIGTIVIWVLAMLALFTGLRAVERSRLLSVLRNSPKRGRARNVGSDRRSLQPADT